MSNYKEELDSIESQVQEKKEQKIKLESKKQQLEEERTKILGQLKEENLTEEKLQETIDLLDKDIQMEITQCKKTLA